MRNYIILNGKNSNEINGLLIQELPPISKPLIRTEVEEIDGRDGDIVTPLGYSAYDKEFTIGLYNDFDINEVAAYFNSEGTVTFSNEPDKYYYYQITAQIDFERLVRYRTATVTMHCQPFKYSATEQPITEDVSGTVSDEGTNLALENTAEAPFNTLDLKGNTGQQTYTGKNKFPCVMASQYPNSSELKVETDAKTGTITFTALGTSGSQLGYFNTGELDASSRYTISMQAKKVSGTAGDDKGRFYVRYRTSSDGSTWTGYTDLIQQAVASVGTYYKISGTVSGSKYYQFLFYNYASNPAPVGEKTEYKNIQLVAGSTADYNFEPYVGGTDSPNPDYPQAVQTVTGENVVKIRGKNLLKLPSADTAAGVTYSINSDGTFNIHGTNNSGREILFSLYLDSGEFQSVDYTLGAREALPYGLTCRCEIYRGNTWKRSFVSVNYTRQTQTGTPDFTDANRVRVAITIANGATVNIDNVGIQLEKGSSASSFEPYQSQSYEINLGKNLFDGENANAKTGYILNDSGTEVSDNTGGYTRNYSAVRPNTTYTISGMAGAGTRRIYFYDGGKTFLSRTSGYNGAQTITFTTPANCYFVNVQIYTNTDTSSAMESWQLELGSTATSYAAYFAPIELCKIGDYQDSIYKNLTDNKWYVRKEITKLDLSTISASQWAYYAAGNNMVFYAIVPNAQYGSASSNPIISDRFISEFSAINGRTFLSGSQMRINFCTNVANNTSDWMAWLASNLTTVYYALATPTDTEITNEALIQQLDDIYYHAHAYKGRTHITSSAATGNVPHIIAAEVGEDNESTITNAGNYLSKPKITVYGSGDISLYINDMHVLQITLGNEGYITIDTAQMEAYKDTLDNLKNRLVIGDYSNARLKPGANKIHFTGTVTKYIVENYSRWL